jgi:hypothetical protein
MTRRRKGGRGRGGILKGAQYESLYFLDLFSLMDIRQWGGLINRLIGFHWQYYCALAHQRSVIIEKIRNALLAAAQGPVSFEHWQRAVKYKYSLDPLSSMGSLADPGGRFNIGLIDPIKFPPFPALYIAFDQETALQEMLCQDFHKPSSLTPFEFALTNRSSITIVSVSGSLDRVIDLGHPSFLQEFVELIRDFKIPAHVMETARRCKLPPPRVICSVDELLENLLYSNWRQWPMQFDVPVASQIFGHLVSESGIDGILYPSRLTGKNCLAIFPKNFADTGSFIKLDDPIPAEVRCRRLDSSSGSSKM